MNFWNQNFYRYSHSAMVKNWSHSGSWEIGNWITVITERNEWTHFDGLVTKRLLTYYDFLIRHLEKRKKSFLKPEKRKIRILEHWLGGPNALWPTEPKFWVGHGQLGYPYSTPYAVNYPNPGHNSHMLKLTVSSVICGDKPQQRTFPAKTFPGRSYGSDVWYPKCGVLVPHVLPPIWHSSTTSYLPSPSMSYCSSRF